ncbi:hypothetical protein N9Y17_00400 [Gammaproteobacteria bacterium]|nr:hypothetical protein [Gammaproteobacteria bacterium]
MRKTNQEVLKELLKNKNSNVSVSQQVSQNHQQQQQMQIDSHAQSQLSQFEAQQQQEQQLEQQQQKQQQKQMQQQQLEAKFLANLPDNFYSQTVYTREHGYTNKTQKNIDSETVHLKIFEPTVGLHQQQALIDAEKLAKTSEELDWLGERGQFTKDMKQSVIWGIHQSAYEKIKGHPDAFKCGVDLDNLPAGFGYVYNQEIGNNNDKQNVILYYSDKLLADKSLKDQPFEHHLYTPKKPQPAVLSQVSDNDQHKIVNASVPDEILERINAAIYGITEEECKKTAHGQISTIISFIDKKMANATTEEKTEFWEICFATDKLVVQSMRDHTALSSRINSLSPKSWQLFQSMIRAHQGPIHLADALDAICSFQQKMTALSADVPKAIAAPQSINYFTALHRMHEMVDRSVDPASQARQLSGLDLGIDGAIFAFRSGYAPYARAEQCMHLTSKIPFKQTLDSWDKPENSYKMTWSKIENRFFVPQHNYESSIDKAFYTLSDQQKEVRDTPTHEFKKIDVNKTRLLEKLQKLEDHWKTQYNLDLAIDGYYQKSDNNEPIILARVIRSMVKTNSNSSNQFLLQTFVDVTDYFKSASANKPVLPDKFSKCSEYLESYKYTVIVKHNEFEDNYLQNERLDHSIQKVESNEKTVATNYLHPLIHLTQLQSSVLDENEKWKQAKLWFYRAVLSQPRALRLEEYKKLVINININQENSQEKISQLIFLAMCASGQSLRSTTMEELEQWITDQDSTPEPTLEFVVAFAHQITPSQLSLVLKLDPTQSHIMKLYQSLTKKLGKIESSDRLKIFLNIIEQINDKNTLQVAQSSQLSMEGAAQLIEKDPLLLFAQLLSKKNIVNPNLTQVKDLEPKDLSVLYQSLSQIDIQKTDLLDNGCALIEKLIPELTKYKKNNKELTDVIYQKEITSAHTQVILSKTPSAQPKIHFKQSSLKATVSEFFTSIDAMIDSSMNAADDDKVLKTYVNVTKFKAALTNIQKRLKKYNKEDANFKNLKDDIDTSLSGLAACGKNIVYQTMAKTFINTVAHPLINNMLKQMLTAQINELWLPQGNISVEDAAQRWSEHFQGEFELDKIDLSRVDQLITVLDQVQKFQSSMVTSATPAQKQLLISLYTDCQLRFEEYSKIIKHIESIDSLEQPQRVSLIDQMISYFKQYDGKDQRSQCAQNICQLPTAKESHFIYPTLLHIAIANPYPETKLLLKALSTLFNKDQSTAATLCSILKQKTQKAREGESFSPEFLGEIALNRHIDRSVISDFAKTCQAINLDPSVIKNNKDLINNCVKHGYHQTLHALKDAKNKMPTLASRYLTQKPCPSDQDLSQLVRGLNHQPQLVNDLIQLTKLPSCRDVLEHLKLRQCGGVDEGSSVLQTSLNCAIVSKGKANRPTSISQASWDNIVDQNVQQDSPIAQIIVSLNGTALLKPVLTDLYQTHITEHKAIDKLEDENKKFVKNIQELENKLKSANESVLIKFIGSAVNNYEAMPRQIELKRKKIELNKTKIADMLALRSATLNPQICEIVANCCQIAKESDNSSIETSFSKNIQALIKHLKQVPAANYPAILALSQDPKSQLISKLSDQPFDLQDILSDQGIQAKNKQITSSFKAFLLDQDISPHCKNLKDRPKIFAADTSKEELTIEQLVSELTIGGEKLLKTNTEGLSQAKLKKDLEAIQTCHGKLKNKTTQDLQNDLAKNEEGQSDNIQKIAVLCELMYRTTGKMPRITQVLPLLMMEGNQNHLIFNIRTGEGKSVTSALIAAYQHKVLGIENVNIDSANDFLAHEGYEQFDEFFRVVKGNSCTALIGQSSKNIDSTFAYSCPASNAIYRLNQDLQNKSYDSSGEHALIIDEVDQFMLDTAETFNLSCPDKSATALDESFYMAVLDFLKLPTKKEYDSCSNNLNELAKDLESYLKNQGLDKGLTAVQLEEMLTSAHAAQGMKEGTDFVTDLAINPEVLNGRAFRKPVILCHGQKAPQSQWQKGVHQFVSARLKRIQTSKIRQWKEIIDNNPKSKQAVQAKKNIEDAQKYSYACEPASITVASHSPQTYLQCYKNRRVVGLTGTSGDKASHQLMQTVLGEKKLDVIHVPAFQKAPSHMSSIFGLSDQQKANEIKQISSKYSQKPILVYVKDIKAAKQLESQLKSLGVSERVKRLDGSTAGKQEQASEAVEQASKSNDITIVTECFTRGADFCVPNDKRQGNVHMVLIDMSEDPFERSIKQFIGRGQRNGQKSRFYKLTSAKDSHEFQQRSAKAVAEQVHNFEEDRLFNAVKAKVLTTIKDQYKDNKEQESNLQKLHHEISEINLESCTGSTIEDKVEDFRKKTTTLVDQCPITSKSCELGFMYGHMHGVQADIKISLYEGTLSSEYLKALKKDIHSVTENYVKQYDGIKGSIRRLFEFANGGGYHGTNGIVRAEFFNQQVQKAVSKNEVNDLIKQMVQGSQSDYVSSLHKVGFHDSSYATMIQQALNNDSEGSSVKKQIDLKVDAKNLAHQPYLGKINWTLCHALWTNHKTQHQGSLKAHLSFLKYPMMLTLAVMAIPFLPVIEGFRDVKGSFKSVCQSILTTVVLYALIPFALVIGSFTFLWNVIKSPLQSLSKVIDGLGMLLLGLCLALYHVAASLAILVSQLKKAPFTNIFMLVTTVLCITALLATAMPWFAAYSPLTMLHAWLMPFSPALAITVTMVLPALVVMSFFLQSICTSLANRPRSLDHSKTSIWKDFLDSQQGNTERLLFIPGAKILKEVFNDTELPMNRYVKLLLAILFSPIIWSFVLLVAAYQGLPRSLKEFLSTNGAWYKKCIVGFIKFLVFMVIVPLYYSYMVIKHIKSILQVVILSIVNLVIILRPLCLPLFALSITTATSIWAFGSLPLAGFMGVLVVGTFTTLMIGIEVTRLAKQPSQQDLEISKLLNQSKSDSFSTVSTEASETYDESNDADDSCVSTSQVCLISQ